MALSLPLFVLALSLAVAWIVAAVLFPLWSEWVAVSPRLARWSVWVAVLPVVVGAILALSSVIPGDPHLNQFFSCHCATSMPGWLHLCPLHPSRAAGLMLPSLAVLAVLLPGRWRSLGAVISQPLGHGGGAEPTVVDLPEPTAVLHGWLRPSLVVDRGLWESLSSTHRDALAAHERGHLRRRDPLTLMLLRGVVCVGPPSAGHGLIRGWLDHAEFSADAIAADELGDPVLVAEALLRCAQVGVNTRQASLSWTGGRLEQRIQALLDGRGEGPDSRPDVGVTDLLGVFGLGMAALYVSPWLHHQVEHFLNLSL
jgi:Zn-dependent protease with chaperone function